MAFFSKYRPQRMRSAYQGGKYKNTAASKITAAIRRKKRSSRPSNWKPGLNRVERKQVKKIIANRKEYKFCPNWYAYDDYAVTGGYIQTTIQPDSYLENIYDPNNDRAVAGVGFQTGNYLNAASNAVNTSLPGTFMYPLGGYSMLRGDGSNEIDGDYAYIHSAMITLQINTKPLSGNVTTTEDSVSPLMFRVIQVKAKKVATGTTPSLNKSLFLDLMNDADGLTMAGSTKEAMIDYPINTNQFQKLRDFKFLLTQTVQPSYAGNISNQPTPQTAHPTQKNLKFWLPKPAKKVRFSDTNVQDLNNHEPLNWDYNVYTIILCARQSGGAMGYSDTSRAWTVKVTGQSKFRET